MPEGMWRRRSCRYRGRLPVSVAAGRLYWDDLKIQVPVRGTSKGFGGDGLTGPGADCWGSSGFPEALSAALPFGGYGNPQPMVGISVTCWDPEGMLLRGARPLRPGLGWLGIRTLQRRELPV